MKFVRTVLELDIYGEQYKLRFPTMAEFSHFADEADKAAKIAKRIEKGEKGLEEGTNEVQLTYRLLAKLGLPQSVCEGLEPRHLTEIVDSLAPKK